MHFFNWMKLKLELTHLVLLVAPIVIGEAIVALPSQAVTLASSEASLNIDLLSQAPQDVSTITNTGTYTLATDGTVTANATAIATAFTPNQPQGFSNFSQGITRGEGRSYLGQAQSFATVIGLDFSIESSNTFSFSFDSFLGLNTSIEYSRYESASAAGELSFQVFDSTNGSLLDYFTISGNLATLGESDFLSYNKSTYVTFDPDSNGTSFERTQESSSASVKVKGKYSRYFANSTSLTLIEFERNEASVKAVPEASSTLALLFFGLLGVKYGARSKARKLSPLTR